MSDEELLERITCDPAILGGKPAISGMRLSAEFIVNLLAHGASTAEILEEYNGLAPEDVQACLLFASHALSNTFFMPLDTKSA